MWLSVVRCSQRDAWRDVMPHSPTQLSVVGELSPGVNTDSVSIRRTWRQPKVIRAGPPYSPWSRNYKTKLCMWRLQQQLSVRG